MPRSGGNAAEEVVVKLEREGLLHTPALGPLLAREVHPKKHGVALVHARSVERIPQHAAPCALARCGGVAFSPLRS
jgi:chorismate-pyruvate lyase